MHMKKEPIIIHVGLPKTATTTLQMRVFPKHEELYSLGGSEYRNEAIRHAIGAITKQDRLWARTLRLLLENERELP